MNHKEIEMLKHTITNLVRQGCRLRIPELGVDGKLVGAGFKPFWTGPSDSRIEKLEFDIMNGSGRIMPLSLHYITGYDIIAQDNRNLALSRNVSIDIHVYNPRMSRKKTPIDRIRADISVEGHA